jgi:hypothetical protein
MRETCAALITLAMPFLLMANSVNLSTWAWDSKADTVSWNYPDPSSRSGEQTGMTVAGTSIPIKYISAIVATQENASRTDMLCAAAICVHKSWKASCAGPYSENSESAHRAPSSGSATDSVMDRMFSWRSAVSAAMEDDIEERTARAAYSGNGETDAPTLVSYLGSDPLLIRAQESARYCDLARGTCMPFVDGMDGSPTAPELGYEAMYPYFGVPELTTAALALAVIAFLSFRHRVKR